MKNITFNNFKEEYQELRENIHKATFISLDCEFSGLQNNNESLFDSARDRYLKLRGNVSDYVVLQFGLSLHKCDRDTNHFSSVTYCVHLLPSTAPGIQANLCLQTSAIEFLSKAGFDWSSAFQNGVSYVSRFDGKQLQRLIVQERLVSSVANNFLREHYTIIRTLNEKVATWASSDGSESMELELPPSTNCSFAYYISQDIRNRNPNLWVTYTSYNFLTVTKVSDEEKQKLIDSETPHGIVTEYFRGFSQVFEDLVAAKKPVVGHNCLRDLGMLYQQFVGPLPYNYAKFKKEIHELFPFVYDTKHLSYNVQRFLPKEMDFDAGSLNDLFIYFSQGKGMRLALYAPQFETKCEGKFHNAGYDAYCTGFCFARLAYYFSIFASNRTVTFPYKPLNWPTLISSVHPYKNCINVIRCQVNHINLSGADPASQRPLPLYIKSSTPLDLTSLDSLLARFGTIDMRILSKHEVMLALPNHTAAGEAISILRKHKYYVSQSAPFTRRMSLIILWTLVSALSIGALLRRNT